MAKNSKVAKSAPAPKSTNGLAIAGFVCSFFFQILGLVFSIIGLVQVNKSGDKGKGLAIAGIIISAVIIFISILVTIAVVLFGLFAANRVVTDIDWPEYQNCTSFEYSLKDGKHDFRYDCEF